MRTKVLFACIYIFISGLFLNKSFAVSYPWTPVSSSTDTPNIYYYYYTNQTLGSILIKFAKDFGVQISFNNVPKNILKTKISGKFKVNDPSEILQKFSTSYGFSWFYYSSTLYISNSQTSTQNIYVAPEMIPSVKSILINDGLLDNRFGWSEISAEGTIIITGPEKYIRLIREKVKKLDISPIGQQFAVFRLKYASADDVSVTFQNNKITIPGIATILKAVLVGNQNISPGVDNKLLEQVVEPIRNTLKVTAPNLQTPLNNAENQVGPPANSNPMNSDSTVRSVLTSPVIQADSRLNTILVRDKSINMPIYKSLIDLLDVPAPLIQVEVMIIDVDQVKMNESGVNWWASGNPGSLKSPVAGGYGANNLGSSTKPGNSLLSLSYGNVSPGNLVVSGATSFISSLQFLEENGFAKVKSKSAVITIDNIAAVVDLTQSFFTMSQPGSQGATQGRASMSMQIIPHLIFEHGRKNKKKIKLTVTVQDGHVEETLHNSAPSTIQGDLNSQAVIDEDNSLLMAGFTRVQTEEVEVGIPILMSIPIIGWFFKHSVLKNQQFQRSYLITPKVIWYDTNRKVPNYSLLKNSTPKKHK